ncbi:MAG TPA: sigma factor [Polyangiaceae bacterium]|nr:sigma factor [Polyangiaceae bacterium]
MMTAEDESRSIVASDFRRIFDDHARYVWRVLRRMGVTQADLPDVAQEVFLILRAKLDRVQSPRALRSFIYGTNRLHIPRRPRI